jgi:hypothetical protein
MAEVVVDENELNGFVAAKKLLEQINNDPRTRPLLTRAIKAHYPNTVTNEDLAAEVARPYIEEVRQTKAQLEEMFGKMAARERYEEERQTLSDLDRSFSRLKKTYGYNDEGIDKIKALMIDRSIPDPDAAAALFERQNPKPTEARSSWEPDAWDLKDNAVEVDVAGLFADPEKWADREVGRVLVDIRSNQDS